MSFQWIINNAVDISISKKDIVAQTVARDQTVRAISRGGNIWRFTVTPSPGTYYKDARGYIETIEQFNRITPDYINFNRPEFKYLFGYQGSATTTTGWSATVSKGSLSFVTSNGPVSGYKFKKGDFVQFNGHTAVYSVTSDVLYNSNSVSINRPAKIANGTYGLNIGLNVTWKIICSKLPSYKITPLGIIEWDGNFEFSEYLE